MTTIYNAGVITPDEVIRPGWVQIEEGRVTALGSGQPPVPQT